MDSDSIAAAATAATSSAAKPREKPASCSPCEEPGVPAAPSAGKAKPNPKKGKTKTNQPSKAKPSSGKPPKTSSNEARIPKMSAPSKSPVGDDYNTRLARLESMISTLVDASASGRAKGPGMHNSSPRGSEQRRPPEAEIDDVDMEPECDYDYDPEDESIPVAGQAESDCSLTNPAILAKPSDKIPAFAAKFAVPTGVGEHLDEEIANTARFYLQEALDETALDETYKKYPMPGNCFPLKTPKVNPTVWENLPTPTRTRDLKLQKIEKALTTGITAFASTLDAATLSEAQNDALGLLCHANYELNQIRRDLIKPELDANCSQLCKPSNPVTNYLFGDDLGKQVKELQEQKKAVAGVMKGQKMRPSKQFHPYKKPGDRYRSQPRAGSWSPRESYRPPVAGTSRSPFLGQRPSWKRDPPARTYTPTSMTSQSRGRQAQQPHRQGLGRK